MLDALNKTENTSAMSDPNSMGNTKVAEDEMGDFDEAD